MVRMEAVSRVVKTAALWLCLVLPSVFIVQKYFGWLGLVGYGSATAWAVCALPQLCWRPTKRQLFWLTTVTFTSLLVLFAVGYPIADTHIPGMGSDDDDAMNIAVRELLHGRFPYYVRTYLGNRIHHLPGALLLATPFVLLGTSALQNLAWLTFFFFVLRRELGDSFAALRWFWLMLIGSPIIAHEVITGTGHVANALYVMLGLWWLIHAEQKLLPAAVWGVALSSRANFLFLIPLACVWLAQRDDWRTSARLATLTCIVCAVITLPFYFFDKQEFAPLEAANRLTRFENVLPHASWAIAVGMGLLSVILACRTKLTPHSLWRNCALVQAFPVVVGYILGHDLTFLSYGSFFLPFGVLAAASNHRHDQMRDRNECAARTIAWSGSP
jgi:hypothetical protein